MMKSFFLEVVNVFQRFIFAKKSSAIAARDNPKCASVIFLTTFTAALLDIWSRRIRFLEQLFFETFLRI